MVSTLKLAYGFHENIPFADYCKIDAMNFSALKYMERSPMAYRHNIENPSEPTAAMLLGTHAHTAILEPHMYKFATWSGPGIRSGNAYKDWCAQNDGKILLNAKEEDHIRGMVQAVHANPNAHKYLRHIRSEVTMVWKDLTFKRDFKARVDAITDIEDDTGIENETVLISLKMTTDVRDFRFAAQYHKLCYHAQDAIYQQGYYYLTGTLPRMVTIAIESKPPHESAVYRIPIDVLRQGQRDVERWLLALQAAELSGRWPGAMPDEQDLALPSYAYPGGDFEVDDLEPIAR